MAQIIKSPYFQLICAYRKERPSENAPNFSLSPACLNVYTDNRHKGNGMKHSESQYTKPSNLLLKKLLFPVAVVCAIFLATEGFDLYEDYAQYRMETDPAFAQYHDRALSILHNRGYEVHDSDTDLHWARPVLEFEAYKGSLEYKIVMSYPDLNIIEERVDL